MYAHNILMYCSQRMKHEDSTTDYNWMCSDQIKYSDQMEFGARCYLHSLRLAVGFKHSRLLFKLQIHIHRSLSIFLSQREVISQD